MIKTEGELMNELICEKLGSLSDRWRDEKNHEDWADYVSVIREIVEASGVTFVSCPKRGRFAFNWIGRDGAKRETKLSRNRVSTVRFK